MMIDNLLTQLDDLHQ